MNKQEFLKKIDQISMQLWIDIEGCESGLCIALDEAFGCHNDAFLKEELLSLYRENFLDVHYWWGKPDHFENQATRFIALCFFEQWCLDNECYRDW